MNNIIKFLQDDLPEYKSEKLFGIFILGKRVQMYSGVVNWTSYNAVKIMVMLLDVCLKKHIIIYRRKKILIEKR